MIWKISLYPRSSWTSQRRHDRLSLQQINDQLNMATLCIYVHLNLYPSNFDEDNMVVEESRAMLLLDSNFDWFCKTPNLPFYHSATRFHSGSWHVPRLLPWAPHLQPALSDCSMAGAIFKCFIHQYSDTMGYCSNLLLTLIASYYNVLIHCYTDEQFFF